MHIYKLGKQGNLRSVTIFHAMARLGVYGLVLVEPAETFVSVGYFDRTCEILDLDRCRKLGIPVIRREVGGGTVLLHEGQVFYQLILPREKAPFRVQEAYRKFSEPVLRTYARLGLEAEYRPINDIVVRRNKKKISGQGAADIENSFVFVGGVLLTFNHRLMAELFRVSDESLRPKIYKYLKNNVTSLEEELGTRPSSRVVEDLLAEEFSRLFEFEGEGTLGEEVFSLADRLKEELTAPEVLLEDTGRKHRLIKIKEGLYVRAVRTTVNGRRLKLELESDGECIRNLRIEVEGIPGKRLRALEEKLIGLAYQRETLEEVIGEVLPEYRDLLLDLLYGS
ncbi:MAG: lipoate--protein ligase family protein [Aquificae bacterium]|nr:lipoate--protein ligase family protein [Aquificota bacterium]